MGALGHFMLADTDTGLREPALKRITASAARYGVSAFGPLAISGAHFAASLLFLHALSRAEFGMFSFLLIVVPFCLSISGALIGASVSRAASHARPMDEAGLATHFKVNLLLSALAGAFAFALLCASHAGIGLAFLLGAYAGTMTLRWFARTLSYATRTPLRVAVSDMTYAGFVIIGLFALSALHALTAFRAGEILFGAAFLGLAAFGPDYLRSQFWPARSGSLFAFRRVWLDLARWSVLGVVLTELTANAHAYLVTFLWGPSAFALLAVGSLLMRPVVLVLAALPDLERPVMSRKIAAGDRVGACRTVKEFRTAVGAIWLATIALACVLLMLFPHLILKRGYDETQALVVLAFWAAITAVRVLRTPESVLLQAAGEFRALAGASMWSCIASLAVTLTLLLTFGPIASLGGLLAGDVVMTSRIFMLSGRWKRGHA